MTIGALNSNLAQQELAKRELARRHMRYFVPYVFPEYRVRPHNVLIADTLDLVVYGVLRRVMIFLPPQYGKSELVSRKTAPFVLGNYPDKNVMLCSYAATLASTLSRHARDLMYSPLYRNLFDISIDDGSRAVYNWRIANRRGGMLAMGVGGGITGHPSDFTIIDDPVKDDVEASSIRTRDAHEDWYWASVDTRLSPGAPVVLCMTRWHDDDLAGRLMRNRKGEPWYILRLPAIAETYDQRMAWADHAGVDPNMLLTRPIVNQLARKNLLDVQGLGYADR